MRCCSHALCLLADLQLPVPAAVTSPSGGSALPDAICALSFGRHLPLAVPLLDVSGGVRRYELRAPFAAWLARQAAGSAHNPAILESMRRYEVGAWGASGLASVWLYSLY